MNCPYLQSKCQKVAHLIISSKMRPGTTTSHTKRHTTLRITSRRSKSKWLLNMRPTHTVSLQRYTLIPRKLRFKLTFVIYSSGIYLSTSKYRSESPLRCVEELLSWATIHILQTSKSTESIRYALARFLLAKHGKWSPAFRCKMRELC